MLKFITGNKNKFREAQKILHPIQIERVNISLHEIQEIDPHKIIKHKTTEALRLLSLEPNTISDGVFIEDVSFCLSCLKFKLPGPLIKWFEEAVGNQWMVKLSKSMRDNKAKVKVTIGYAKSVDDIKFFEADLEGKIVNQKGKGGFGFDPIFMPKGYKKTNAQLKSEGNFEFSARGKAMKKFKKYLEISLH
jgi:non-canonical purine NTP pyrophosphatase (RdgB/HAM1 family)